MIEINNFNIIKPVSYIILLLSQPMTNNGKHNLYQKWIRYIREAYDNRNDYLEIINIRSNCPTNNSILDKKFKKNYENMKNNFALIHTLNVVNKTKIKKKTFSENKEYIKPIIVENENNELLKLTNFQMVTFIFQYLNEFDEQSININLWNYCLKSVTFSLKNCIVGLIILICQYTYLTSLFYHTIKNFNPSQDTFIILITVISTIISFLYSYKTILSFYNSLKLYRFLLTLYTDYPSLIFNNKNNERNINMSKGKIRYNLIADFLSNFILPLIIPFINIFIILNSETIIDSILNCMAIFFIIQIDEEVYSTTDYKTEKRSIIFTRWIISNIYCNTFQEFNNIYRLEINNKKIYKKNKKIHPKDAIINMNM